MKNLFNYTFYRTSKRHFKRDGAEAFTGVLTVSFIVFLYCIPLYNLIIDILGLNQIVLYDKIVLCLIGLFIFLFFRKKYTGKYFIFRDKWVNETKREKLLGEILIVIFFFSPLLLMFVVKYFFK